MATLMLEQGNGVDLDRLNEAERQVLRLLAEGHTAKSVANEIGSTTASVNERLREARRKTGAGSSRELARLLKSQENRHDEMGVGSAEADVNASPRLVAKSWHRSSGVIVMASLLAIGFAGAAAVLSQAPSAPDQTDPLLGSPIDRYSQPADLHAKVRSEPRDAEWASRIETSARARLLQISPVGKAGNELRVTCASTLCEFAGTFLQPGPIPAKYDPDEPVNRAVSDLQGKSLNDDFSNLGLKSESGNFLRGKGNPSRLVYLLYYSREK